MANLFNIGVSGLRAQQAALAVTGQNITNASTPGYTRQRVDIQAQAAGARGGDFEGSGARLERIERVTDDFATNQVRVDTALFSELDTLTQQIQQIEATLLDENGGLDSALQGFFGALQLASNNPSDLPTRQLVISQAENLAQRFNGIHDRLNDQYANVTSVLESSAARVNELTRGISELNYRIAGLRSEESTGALNGLLDQREEMLRELSTFVSVSVSEQQDQQVNVFIGKGQAIVLGASASILEVTAQGEIALRSDARSERQIITSALQGGEMGGAMTFRDQVLTPAINQLGRIALAVSAEVNQAHAGGVDLNGDRGGLIFADLNAPEFARLRAVADEGNENPNPGAISVRIDDPTAVAVSDYELVFAEDAPGAFYVRRLSDRQQVFQGRIEGEFPQTLSFDNLTVTLEKGDFQPGDKYYLRPLRSAAGSFRTVIDNPALLALAGPLRVQEALGNRGEAVVRIGEVFDQSHPIFADDGALTPPLLIRFTSATSYDVLDNSDPGNPRQLVPPLRNLSYDPGQLNQMLPAQAGAQLVVFDGIQTGALPDAATILPAGGTLGNGYSSQVLTATRRDPATGSVLSSQSVDFTAGSSAREIAARLSGVSGVTATAFTEVRLSELNSNGSGTPLAVVIDGVDLGSVRSLDELADRIGSDPQLRDLGVRASSDGATLTLTDLQGDDLQIQVAGDPTDSLRVTGLHGDGLVLNGAGPGNAYRSIAVGGQVSANLAADLTLSSPSGGVMQSAPRHLRADFGFGLTMSGTPEAGDTFSVDYNQDGVGDNRNGLRMAGLLTDPVLGSPPLSFSDSYGQLVQFVGVQSSQNQINRDAASSLLEQSTGRKESISGVNLDEEAANLIRYEQAYNASAQIISVARQIFDTLFSVVR
ncbi:MAG: flagellar hook-associated protein FlgK [Pseudomonadales bacterium]